MAVLEIEKIILVTRQTRLEDSLKRYNTKSQVKFYIESRGQSFQDYELEYNNYQRARDLVIKSIPPEIRFQLLDRQFLPNFVFGPRDLVVCLGQDGLVVNVAKYLNGQPILAFNPDPDRFDGILLPFTYNEAQKIMHETLAQSLDQRSISMGRADLNDGQSLLAFNDFFIGANSHISARYRIAYQDQTERHSSSGIIVSTPAGSTGWLSSLYNMAQGIQEFKGDQVDWMSQAMSWEENRLVFIVREPFRSKWSAADLVAGEIQPDNELKIESLMPEKGIIFSDGIEKDYIEFNSGSEVRIRLAEQKTHLLVPKHFESKKHAPNSKANPKIQSTRASKSPSKIKVKNSQKREAKLRKKMPDQSILDK